MCLGTCSPNLTQLLGLCLGALLNWGCCSFKVPQLLNATWPSESIFFKEMDLHQPDIFDLSRELIQSKS